MQGEVSEFCISTLAAVLRIPKAKVEADTKFTRLGLDSAMTVYWMMEIEEKFGLELSPDDFQNHPDREQAVSLPRREAFDPFLGLTSATGLDVRSMQTFSSLVDLLEYRATAEPSDRAYVVLSDRGAEEAAITFLELQRAASALAARLTPVTRPGDRALLMFPTGLEFMIGFFGCLMARVIPVPMMVPRRQTSRDASERIISDCAPSAVLVSPALAEREDLRARFRTDRSNGSSWIEPAQHPA